MRSKQRRASGLAAMRAAALVAALFCTCAAADAAGPVPIEHPLAPVPDGAIATTDAEDAADAADVDDDDADGSPLLSSPAQLTIATADISHSGACSKDIQQFCRTVFPLYTRTAACLQAQVEAEDSGTSKHVQTVSEDCREEVKHFFGAVSCRSSTLPRVGNLKSECPTCAMTHVRAYRRTRAWGERERGPSARLPPRA